MYDYRRMSQEARQQVLEYRRLIRLPLHEPPHFLAENRTYLLTAACFNHHAVLATEPRRIDFERELLDGLSDLADSEVFAWCILPNHYHVLARLDLDEFARWCARLHNRTATRWNRQDDEPGRKVWFRFVDRAIRNEHHFWATMNYIHANPVKHRYVAKTDQWRCSSFHVACAIHGRPALQQMWRDFPVQDYGKGWDW